MQPGRTPGLFSKDSPDTPLPPAPPVPATGVLPGLLSEGGVSLRFLLHFSLRFRGREKDWGSQLLLGSRLRLSGPETLAVPGGTAAITAGALPPPTGAYLFRAALRPCLYPRFSLPGGLGPDVSPASPRPGPAARSCLPQPPSRGSPAPPPTPPHGPGAMSELEQLRQEAEQLRNQIRVRAWRAAERAGPGWLVCVYRARGRQGRRGVRGGGSTLISSCLILSTPVSSVLFPLSSPSSSLPL